MKKVRKKTKTNTAASRSRKSFRLFSPEGDNESNGWRSAIALLICAALSLNTLRLDQRTRLAKWQHRRESSAEWKCLACRLEVRQLSSRMKSLWWWCRRRRRQWLTKLLNYAESSSWQRRHGSKFPFHIWLHVPTQWLHFCDDISTAEKFTNPYRISYISSSSSFRGDVRSFSLFDISVRQSHTRVRIIIIINRNENSILTRPLRRSSGFPRFNDGARITFTGSMIALLLTFFVRSRCSLEPHNFYTFFLDGLERFVTSASSNVGICNEKVKNYFLATW